MDLGPDPPVLAADLREASFDDWLAFVFDREPRPVGAASSDAWYWANDVQLTVDPARQVAHLARLFGAPALLARRYSPEQVEEGFWFMLGPAGNTWHTELLWDPAVPWEEREACIRAIPALYERLFDRDEEGEGVAWMLWDLLAYDYDCGNRDPTASEEDRRVQDAMLEAMREMLLRSDSAAAQRAALHGLFHLNHQKGPGLIRVYLESRWTSQSLRDYAEQVLRGEAL